MIVLPEGCAISRIVELTPGIYRHIHIIMGGITAHALRQKKNGQKAAQRAHSREQSKHGAGAVVELAEPVEGPSRA